MQAEVDTVICGGQTCTDCLVREALCGRRSHSGPKSEDQTVSGKGGGAPGLAVVATQSHKFRQFHEVV